MPDSQSVFQPNTQAELAQFVADNAADSRRSLQPIGGGTTPHDVNATDACEVRLDGLNRVIDYPARDMTITVEAGIRIAELNRLLAAENQRLPIDVPQAEQATLGGVIATNWSGSRRFGCGTMRDYVIGISAIDASGQRFSAGGRVVKNVAGYDLCKLLIGSRGTLAIISQVTLKLRPIPEETRIAAFGFHSTEKLDAALARLVTSATRPIAIDVSNEPAMQLLNIQRTIEKAAMPTMLFVGFEGTRHEVDWQLETVANELRPFECPWSQALSKVESEGCWIGLTEFSIRSASSTTIKATIPPSRTCELVRMATLAGMAAQAHAGNGIVIGHLSERASTADQAIAATRPLGDFVRSCGGHLSVLRSPNEWPALDVVADSWAGSLAWTQRLKRQLDPHSLLNPGVMAFGPA